MSQAILLTNEETKKRFSQPSRSTAHNKVGSRGGRGVLFSNLRDQIGLLRQTKAIHLGNSNLFHTVASQAEACMYAALGIYGTLPLDMDVLFNCPSQIAIDRSSLH